MRRFWATTKGPEQPDGALAKRDHQDGACEESLPDTHRRGVGRHHGELLLRGRPSEPHLRDPNLSRQSAGTARERVRRSQRLQHMPERRGIDRVDQGRRIRNKARGWTGSSSNCSSSSSRSSSRRGGVKERHANRSPSRRAKSRRRDQRGV